MMNDVTIDDIDIAEGDFDDIDSTGDDADIFENVGDRIGKAVLKLTPSLHSTKNFLRKLLSFIEINHFVYIIQI